MAMLLPSGRMLPSITPFYPSPEDCEWLATQGAEIIADETFKNFYRVHATQMWGATHGHGEHERELKPATKNEAVAAGRANFLCNRTAERRAEQRVAVPVTVRAFFAWDKIMQAARTFEDSVKEIKETAT